MRQIYGAMLALAFGAGGAFAADGERITVTGEIIDTWCYYSGVMGPPDAVVGSAHHACALWCSAGGIPVGLLADDGRVFMILKIEDSAESAGGDTALTLASHSITADGLHYRRDGQDYLIIEEVVEDMDIQTENHSDFGVVPGFAIPEEALP